MTTLPVNLYRAVQVRRLDRVAIDEFKIPAATLMERAGLAAFTFLRERWPTARNITVVCGTGNNGGDGFELARLAHRAGGNVRVLTVGARDKVSGDAANALAKLSKVGLVSEEFTSAALVEGDIIVDALLGTGLTGEVTGDFAAVIHAMNNAGIPVLAMDIPSGLHADLGRVLGAAVRADATITFVGLKQGLFTGAGPDHCGVMEFNDLGVPAGAYAQVPPAATRIGDAWLKNVLRPRSRGMHKGDFGHVLIVGGNRGMTGAALMAGLAAARAGAGLVSVAMHTAHADTLSAAQPELMCRGVEDAAQLRALLAKASVVAIGPGLAQDDWAQSMLNAVLDTRLPLVVDADALNLLAREPVKRGNWIITPHPGEAARMLGMRAEEIQNDRFGAVRELQERYDGVVVLKGAGTLVGAADLSIGVCTDGNPGMASGGVGDVLTGVIAGFVAQGLAPKDAAWAGVYAHAVAGDRAARDGERGLMASDVIAQLRAVVNPPA